MCEFPNKSAFDPCLAGDVVTFGDDYSAPNRATVERRAYGLEILGETGVIRLETFRTVEAELSGFKVRVNLCLLASQNLDFACLYQPRYEFVAR